MLTSYVCVAIESLLKILLSLRLPASHEKDGGQSHRAMAQSCLPQARPQAKALPRWTKQENVVTGAARCETCCHRAAIKRCRRHFAWLWWSVWCRCAARYKIWVGNEADPGTFRKLVSGCGVCQGRQGGGDVIVCWVWCGCGVPLTSRELAAEGRSN